jgi:hypothetical protein
MKRYFLFMIGLIVMVTAGACQGSGKVPEMAQVKPVAETKNDLDHFSADIKIPPVLPRTIQEPLLMKGWIALYNRQDPVGLWDGYIISGRQLAEYVIEQEVEVKWNTNPSYTGSWVDRSGTGNVYITPEFKDQTEGQMTRLIEILAHELFHRTAPFGKVSTTLYEEYWAFYTGAYVAGIGQAMFYYTNPLNSASLETWFVYQNRGSYPKKFDRYPEEINPLAWE